MESLLTQTGNWTLSSDEKLLSSVKDVYTSVECGVQQVEEKIKQVTLLARNLDVKLQNTTNRLLLTSNEKFIEARVYEYSPETETIPSHDDLQVNEDLKIQLITEAIGNGINTVKKYYESVQVSHSDSEEEETYEKQTTLVLRNPYLVRPLPYVIGTTEWNDDNLVGLDDDPLSSANDQSDSDSDDSDEGENEAKISVKSDELLSEFSESDEEVDSGKFKTVATTDQSIDPVRKIKEGSESSSESSEEESSQSPTRAYISQKEDPLEMDQTNKKDDFSNELSKKITGATQNRLPVIPLNNKSEMKAKPVAKSVLFDSDSDDDLFTAKQSARPQSVVSKKNAFPEVAEENSVEKKVSENNLLESNSEKSKSKHLSVDFSDDDMDLFADIKRQPETTVGVKPLPLKKTLFDDIEDDDEDDLFFSSNKTKLTEKDEPKSTKRDEVENESILTKPGEVMSVTLNTQHLSDLMSAVSNRKQMESSSDESDEDDIFSSRDNGTGSTLTELLPSSSGIVEPQIAKQQVDTIDIENKSSSGKDFDETDNISTEEKTDTKALTRRPTGGVSMFGGVKLLIPVRKDVQSDESDAEVIIPDNKGSGETLLAVTKDRPKIRKQRRPPTRRGRMANIQTVDLFAEVNVNTPELGNNGENWDDKKEPQKKKLFDKINTPSALPSKEDPFNFDTDDSDDLFNEKTLSEKMAIQGKNTGKEASKFDDLFGDDGDSDDDFFESIIKNKK